MIKEREKHRSKVLILALFLGVSFCYTWAISASAQETIRMGGNIPLTGKVASFGAYSFRGVEMALQDLAGKGWSGGKKIEVIWEDNDYDPRKSILAFNKLVSVDKVNCMIISGAPNVKATAPLAQEKKVVQLYPATSSFDIRKCGDYTFKLMGGQVTESLAMAKFTWDKLKMKKAALITNDTEYGMGGGDLFEWYFKKMGGEIVAREKVRPGEREYSSVIMRVHAKNPEIIVIVQTGVDAGYTVKQAKRLGIKAVLLGSGALYSSETLTTAGEEADGLYALAYQYDPENGTPMMKAFAQNYNKKYGGFPPIFAAAPYDAIMIYADAVKKGARTSDEIKKFFRSVKDYEGVSGTINFDSLSEAMPAHRMMVVKGSVFHEVYRFDRFPEKDLRQ